MEFQIGTAHYIVPEELKIQQKSVHAGYQVV